MTTGKRVGQLVGGISSGILVGYTGIELLKNFPVKVYAEEAVEPVKFPWSHSGLLSSYDHARYFLLLGVGKKLS